MVGQDHDGVLKFRTLRFVHGHGVHGFYVGEAAGTVPAHAFIFRLVGLVGKGDAQVAVFWSLKVRPMSPLFSFSP